MRKIKWPLLTEKGTSGISVDTAGNKLTNGDLELGATTGWTAGNSATLTAESTAAYVRGGSYSLKITENGAANPKASQVLTLTVGETYEFTTYVLGGTELTYYVFVYDNTTAAHIAAATGEANTDRWTVATNNFTVPSGSAAFTFSLELKAAKDSGHYSYFDDVEFYHVHERYGRTLRDTPEGMYVCPKCYDGDHPRNTPRKLRKKQPLRYPS